MGTFAQIALYPGGLVAWLVVGLIAGVLAGYFMKGGGYGIVGDVVMGLVGALVGGFVGGQFVTGEFGFLGTLGIAFLGACLCIAVVRFMGARRIEL